MIRCRPLQEIDEFEAAYNLEIAVWGIDPRDAVPVNLLRALQHGGSSLLGAYDGTRMVGVALAFPARVGERWVLWSHLTGIDRAYQGQGVGFALKLYQRQWALDNGYDEIRWTFDPLQRGNAHFNLRRLGATAERYYVNFYGVMIDKINHANVPSDRVEAVWRLHDPRVEQLPNGEPDDAPDVRAPFLLTDTGLPRVESFDGSRDAYLVQIPRRLPHHESLLAWRLALRQVLSAAFERGYTAVDFTTADAYLLRRA